jgi:hypothetical protein
MKLARSLSEAAKGEGRPLAICLVVVSLSWFGFVYAAAQTSKGNKILTIRVNDSPEGARVAVLADLALNDYEAYRRGDRFFVKIPNAELVASQPYSQGVGFDEVQVHKSGDNVIISFKLQPGATARVEQRQNRLDIVFSALQRPQGSNVAVAGQASSTESVWSQNRERRATEASLIPVAATTGGLEETLPTESRVGVVSPGGQSLPGPVPPGTTGAPANGAPVVSSVIEGSTPAGTSQYPQVSTFDGSVPGSTTPGSNQSRSFLPADERLVNAQRWLTQHWRVVALGGTVVVIALLILLFSRQRRSSSDWSNAKVGPSIIEPSGYVSSVAVPDASDEVVPAEGEAEDRATSPVVPAEQAVGSGPKDEVVQVEPDVPETVAPSVEITVNQPLAAESTLNLSAVEELSVESPFKNEPVTIERTHQEVRKLLAGVEYDAVVINARDSLSRRVVLASLLTALAGRNLEQRNRARKAFVDHGFLDETARDLQTAESPAERAAAARKLGAVAVFAATPHLAVGLHDIAPEVRRACVESLGQIGDGAGISPLTDLLARETNRLVPEAVIRHAINSITVTEAKRASMSDRPALRVVDQSPKAPPAKSTTDDLQLKPATSATSNETPRIAAPSVPTVATSPAPTIQSSMSAEEIRLHQEELALRRAAETLARKRLQAEADRLKAQEEAQQAQLRAENERRMRAEEELRIKAEEEARERGDAELRSRLEVESGMKVAEAERSRLETARRQVEPEPDFRLEAETLRRAAEELARKRAESVEARKRIEEAAQRKLEEARLQAEEDARLRAEAELRARAEEEARLQAEEEARLQAEKDARLRAEAELRARAEEEARLQAEEEVRRAQEEAVRRQAEEEAARRLAEENERRKIEEELRVQVEMEVRLQAEYEARRLAEEELRRRAEEELRRRAEDERRRQEFEAKLREEEANRVAELEILQRVQSESLRQLASQRHRIEEQKFLLEQQALLKAADEVARRRQQIEAARMRAEEEVNQLAAVQEQLRADEEKRREAEEERQRLEAEARSRAEEERKRFEEARRRSVEEQERLEEEARLKAEEEARLLAEVRERIRAGEEARQRAEQEREQLEAEARRRALEEKQRYEEARQLLAEEQQRLEEEARRHAEETERSVTELEAVRQQIEAQSRVRAEQEQRIRAEIEALYQAEAEQRSRIEMETSRRAEAEARLREEKNRREAEEQARIQAEREAHLAEEARLREEEAAHRRAVEEAQARSEREARLRAEEEARQRADNEAQLRAEREARLVAEEEARAQAEVQSREADVVEAERVAAEPEGGTNPPMPDTSDIPMALLDKLTSSSDEERSVALGVLARFGGEGAFQFITHAFDDASPAVRNTAARSLCDLQADRAASFTRALREATPERRRKIGTAIAESGLASEAIANLTGDSRETTYDAFSLLFLMAKAGEVQPLMSAIEDFPNVEVRLAVVKLLALSGQAEIVPAFRRLAVRGSLPPEVRAAVMEAIYQISSQSRESETSAA